MAISERLWLQVALSNCSVVYRCNNFICNLYSCTVQDGEECNAASPSFGMPPPSLPRLRHGTRRALLSLLNQFILFFVSMLVLLLSCSHLTFVTSPWESASLYANSLKSHFSVSQPKAAFAFFDGLNLFFLTIGLAWFIKSSKSLLSSPSRSPQRFILGPILFSLHINDFPASVQSSVIYSLYANNLAIWSFSPLALAAEASQGALIWLERLSEHWCLPLNPSKCEVSFSVDFHQANLQLHISLFHFPLRFNSAPTFLGITVDSYLYFSVHVSELKVKFFPGFKALCCISAF